MFSLEASALYYFQDASVDEFQMYIGGGFGFYFPWERYEETLVDNDTGEPYGETKVEDFSAEPGVHAMLGALYHVKNDVALYLEGRVLMTQSKFTMELPTEGNGMDELADQTDPTRDPSSDRLQDEDIRRVVRKTGTVAQRSAFLLRIRGMSYAEIACDIGTSVNAVRPRISRMREKLQRRLRELGLGPGQSATGELGGSDNDDRER